MTATQSVAGRVGFGSGSLQLTLPSSVTAGQFLVLVVAAVDVVPGVSDNQGNTWLTAINTSTGNSTRNYLFYAYNVAGGSTTVTITRSAETITTVGVLAEYPLATTVDPLGDASAGSTFSSTPGRTVTASGAALLIGGACNESNGTNINSANAEFTEVADDSDIRPTQMQEKHVTSAGTYNAGWTIGGAGASWHTTLAEFTIPAAPGGFVPWHHYRQLRSA